MGILSSAWRKLRSEPVRLVRDIQRIQLERTAALIRAGKRKDNTLRYQLQAWKAIREDLGDVPVEKLTRAKLQKWVDNGVTAPSHRDGQFRVLRAGYRLACNEWEWEPDRDPFQGVELWRERPRERAARDRELGDIFREARSLIEHGTPARSYAARVVLLIALTGCRPSEILMLTWPEVDLDRRMLWLQDSKTGAKPVYLCSKAIEILRATPGERDGRVFATSQMTLRRTWDHIRRQAGAPDLQMRDLRTTYDTLAGELEIPVEDVSKIQSRSIQCSLRSYRMVRSPYLHRLAERIGGRIYNAMEGTIS